jgi:hypothetical protein
VRRPQKPFTVEVKRGGRKSPPGAKAPGKLSRAPTAEDVFKAKPALANQPTKEESAAKADAKKPAGRILMSLLPEPAPEPVVADAPAPKRRGRPPGSANVKKAYGYRRRSLRDSGDAPSVTPVEIAPQAPQPAPGIRRAETGVSRSAALALRQDAPDDARRAKKTALKAARLNHEQRAEVVTHLARGDRWKRRLQKILW